MEQIDQLNFGSVAAPVRTFSVSASQYIDEMQGLLRIARRARDAVCVIEDEIGVAEGVVKDGIKSAEGAIEDEIEAAECVIGTGMKAEEGAIEDEIEAAEGVIRDGMKAADGAIGDEIEAAEAVIEDGVEVAKDTNHAFVKGNGSNDGLKFGDFTSGTAESKSLMKEWPLQVRW